MEKAIRVPIQVHIQDVRNYLADGPKRKEQIIYNCKLNQGQWLKIRKALKLVRFKWLYYRDGET